MLNFISRGQFRLLAFAAVASAAFTVTPASAAIVTYTLSGQLDGSIGSTALTNSAFVWTLKANNLAQDSVAGFPALQALSADIQIRGVGDAVFATPTYVFQGADLSQFAFVDKAGANGVGWTSPNFAQRLPGAIPLQPADFEVALGGFETSLGAFDLTQASGLTFGAVLTPTPPVLYTLSGNISGTLNGAAFVNDPFRWTVTADTSGFVSYMGLPALQGLVSTLRLDGFGDLATTDNFLVAVSADNAEAGFVDPTGSQGVAVASPLFSSYGLGQILAGLPVDFAGAVGVQTSSGLLDIEGASGLTLSAAPPSAVPEPSSWSLAILGFAILGAAVRQGRRTRAASQSREFAP